MLTFGETARCISGGGPKGGVPGSCIRSPPLQPPRDQLPGFLHWQRQNAPGRFSVFVCILRPSYSSLNGQVTRKAADVLCPPSAIFATRKNDAPGWVAHEIPTRRIMTSSRMSCGLFVVCPNDLAAMHTAGRPGVTLTPPRSPHRLRRGPFGTAGPLLRT